jgi:hypothetical protein
MGQAGDRLPHSFWGASGEGGLTVRAIRRGIRIGRASG